MSAFNFAVLGLHVAKCALTILIYIVDMFSQAPGIEFARNDIQEPCRIYVGNLPPGTRAEQVNVLVADYGQVEDIEIKTYAEVTFALIQFKDYKDGIKAVQGLFDLDYYDRALDVGFTTTCPLEIPSRKEEILYCKVRHASIDGFNPEPNRTEKAWFRLG